MFTIGNSSLILPSFLNSFFFDLIYEIRTAEHTHAIMLQATFNEIDRTFATLPHPPSPSSPMLLELVLQTTVQATGVSD